MSSEAAQEYDYVVVGGGSGGIASARRAAAHGAKVLLIEKARLGGTCVNVGCVPKKIMYNAAFVREMLDVAPAYGFRVPSDVPFSWADLKERRDAHVRKLNEIYLRNLAGSGVEHVEGVAEFVGPKEVRVNDRRYRGKHMLLAVGGCPIRPSIPGGEHVLTSDDFFNLEAPPRRVALIGSGYIAVELAGMLHYLGSRAQILVRRDSVLTKFDHEIRERLMQEMARTGLEVTTRAEVARVEKSEDGALTLQLKDGRELGPYDAVIAAIGRQPNTASLNVEAAGVVLKESGHVEVDDWHQTSVPGVYAVGDVIGELDLTPTAIAAGRLLADHLFLGKSRRMRYDNVPTVIFSHPPIGTVGLSEAGAREEYGDDAVKVYRSTFNNLFFAVADAEHKQPTFMKLIVQGPEEKVVGLHVMGMGADEMLQGFGVSMVMGATKADFDRCVAIHPTAAEELVTMAPWGMAPRF